jgi:hypothetical protein
MPRRITCSYSITSSARKKKDSGMVKLGTFSAWMIAPIEYIIQIDCDNDVIITEGDAAG